MAPAGATGPGGRGEGSASDEPHASGGQDGRSEPLTRRGKRLRRAARERRPGWPERASSTARTLVGVAFQGFPAEALTFYEGLEVDNSKAYWTAHRDVYERCVKGAMEELVETV